MKRLLDMPARDRLSIRSHELIRALGPTMPSEVRLRQVKRRLDDAHVRRGSKAGLRVAVVLALVGAGASAFALSGSFESSTPATAVLPAPPAVGAIPSASARHARPLVASAAPTESRPVEPAPQPAAATGRRPTPAAASASASDVARVHEAARALRGEGDPERALRILEASREVSGPLAEEALALRIEAASARGDARAASLARTYMSRYPAGRYSELARRALAAGKP